MAGDKELLEALHPGLRRHIVERNWRFSSIQREAIPAVLTGDDCVIEAPTAGGKTEAVLWPTLTRASASGIGSVCILYLAPLRALLNNLEMRAETYASLCTLKAFKWHGDVSHTEKLEQLRDFPQLLLTTPESLEAIILRKVRWRSMFEDLQAIIIDEAHNFAAGDRGGHVLSLLARLDEAITRSPQRIAVSATIGNPDAMLRWLAPNDRAPARRVSAPPDTVLEDYRVHFFDESDESEETPPEERASWRRLESLYNAVSGRDSPLTGFGHERQARSEPGARQRAIVFVRSRRGAESYAKAVQGFARQTSRPELKLRTHHSAVSKFYREEAERLIQIATEDGLDAILSTSTLELGIDIGELNQVIQCDALTSSSSFLQRVGRTGRRVGRPRVFRGLCTDSDDLLLLTATVSLGQAKRSEALALPRRAFHLLAHQILCLSLQQHGVAPGRAWQILSRAHVFSDVERDEFDELVAHMVAAGFLRDEAGVLVVSDEGERRFLGAGWRRLFAVFDSAPRYEVMDGKTQVGTLDAAFVEAVEAPFLFVLGGRLWEATRVDVAARTVAARRSHAGDAPKWQSFGGPDVPFETAQEVGRILHERRSPNFLDEAGLAALRRSQEEASAIAWRPGVMVATASLSGRVALWTYAGDRINRTMARHVALELHTKTTANYCRVEIVPPLDEAAGSLDRTLVCLGRLRSGTRSEREVGKQLETSLPSYPFSPFAKCLPPRLLATSLAERTFDIAGTMRLLGECELLRKDPQGDLN